MKPTLILGISIILILSLASLTGSVPFIRPIEAEQTTYLDDFTSETGNWNYLGSANRDQLNQNLVLTNSSSDQTGIAIFNAPIRSSFVANFSFICMGSASDGLVMFFYKQKYPQNIDYTTSYGANGVAGGRTGFNSMTIIPGYGIQFDGWQNIAYEFADIAGGQPNPSKDPNSNHIALIKDFMATIWLGSTHKQFALTPFGIKFLYRFKGHRLWFLLIKK